MIHHSAGNFGNIEFLQKIHRQRQSKDLIDAFPHHYIIGNGNGLKMGEVLSDNNIRLLKLINEHHPESLGELARLSGRQTSNLSRTLKTMEKYGIVELKKTCP